MKKDSSKLIAFIGSVLLSFVIAFFQVKVFDFIRITLFNLTYTVYLPFTVLEPILYLLFALIVGFHAILLIKLYRKLRESKYSKTVKGINIGIIVLLLGFYYFIYYGTLIHVTPIHITCMKYAGAYWSIGIYSAAYISNLIYKK